MTRALAPQLLVLATAAAIGVAGVRVASVPTPPSTVRATTTWDSLVEGVRSDVQTTIDGLRRTGTQQRVDYAKMVRDTRALEERLGSATPGG